MGIQCPKCGSDHVQSVRVILDSGTSLSSGTVTGVGVGSGATGYVGTMNGVSQTSLAQRFSPPRKPALWAVFAHAVWSYRKKSAVYKVEFPKWKALYDSGFFCHRCGHTFLS